MREREKEREREREREKFIDCPHERGWLLVDGNVVDVKGKRERASCFKWY